MELTCPSVRPYEIRFDKCELLFFFTGEALVGNEAVDQLVKFNAALADHSSQDNPHLIDGIVLTKFDTIDDKVRIFLKCWKLIFHNLYLSFRPSRLALLSL